MTAPAWFEPPPAQKKGIGCFGKGCLILLISLLLLAALFFGVGYVSVRYALTASAPRELPPIVTSETEEKAVQQRWENFTSTTRDREPATEVVDAAPARTDATQARMPPRIEFSASDINQLIAANRNSRGKAFVSIENNVGHVQISIPLEKVGFPGRYLNGDFDVTASPDGDPWKIRVTNTSLGGIDVPERMLNLLLGAHSLRSYIDQYAGEYAVSKVYVIDNKAVLETGTAR
ncbi:MAG: hypothetical protein ABJB32_02670 [Verrucomicrobiota bacterium]